MNTWKIIAALVSMFCFWDCTTTASIRTAPLYMGVPKPFSAEVEQVLKAAKESVLELGLKIKEPYQVDGKTWVIIAGKGLSLSSYGELVRLVIEQNDGNITTVRVYSKRRVDTNITAKEDYSESILAKIENKLRNK